ncbi:mannose-1-phosphate guanylyltransferase/mannose-6-phosphate isomerase [Gammaproteobacteria bacterium]|nr:mannose-1-phosphate guanylyltransferase/mannose-6-phosphate isomerase [Gammaproteobacteria bacterium]MDC3106060.1 mannose-1-phosphate guanylyltransferase/mannose-6-phosphate isomerase [Gammaproteobacteria bacterium]
MIKAVIMAGGSGTRLWPLSRAAHPKQFLTLHGDDTMLQATFKRLDGLDIQSSVTICNEEHRFFVAAQLSEIDKLGSIILEPVGRNTAPAIALAALSLPKDEDPLLLVLAADHLIQDEVAFSKTVMNAIPLAEAGKLVTFGIVAQEPNTGYGYIKKGKSQGPGFTVDAFVEKPSIEVAKEYLKSADYLWNSGMFLFKASRYLEELKKHRPDIYEACQLSLEDISKDNDFLRVNESSFNACPSDSIDYAVMEKTSDSVVVSMDAGWSDIGSWSSLWDISKKDDKGNAIFGDVMLNNSKNCYVRADGKFVAAVGLDDLVIIDSKDALMVAHKESVQDAKIVVQHLKFEKRSEWELHREVYRPWGKYDSIDAGDNYQVKRLTVNPGAKLSVQMHYHRSEHWVVVAGQARVHYGDKSHDLSVNESTYHGKEVVHALENLGDIPLELIEVQVGSYLGEDDIVRFEDVYGRS